ncbi:hypothetical protein [Paraburkholderia aspalathi]|uniref:hypothetical protein n=1 Tax=Paraburkholderia aspalathi TaxID=1324617 RepID=UPI003CA1BF26
MAGNELDSSADYTSVDELFRTACEGKMTSNFDPMLMPGGESAGPFDSACNRRREITKAGCVAITVIDAESGSGYSVVGPLEAQVLLSDILHGQVSKSAVTPLSVHLTIMRQRPSRIANEFEAAAVS